MSFRCVSDSEAIAKRPVQTYTLIHIQKVYFLNDVNTKKQT